MHRLRLPTLLLTFTLLLVACGGGGGGAPAVEGEADATAPDLTGSYAYVELVSRLGGTMFLEFGPGAIDAAGQISGQSQRYFEGVLTTPESISRAPFLVDLTTGALEERDPDTGELIARGHVGAGGHVALTSAEDALPRATFLVRPDPGPVTGDLAGAYHFAVLSPTDAKADFGRLLLDDAGVARLPAPALGNEAGLPVASTISGFQVEASGDGGVFVTMSRSDLFGAPQLQGVVADAGRLLVANRTDTATPARPLLFAAVPSAVGAAPSLFQGRYALLLFAVARPEPDGTNVFAVVQGTVDADGNGGLILNLRLNSSSDAGETPAVDEPGGYVLAPDGSLRLLINAAVLRLTGGIDPTGRYAVLGGGTEPGGAAVLAILARLP